MTSGNFISSVLIFFTHLRWKKRSKKCSEKHWETKQLSCDHSVCWCFLRRKASVDRMQTLLPLASIIPPPCRLNNEQQCYLFYSVTWLKQTLTIFSKISLKLSFILASLELLHNPLRKFPKKGFYKSVVKIRIFLFPNQHFDNNLTWKRSDHHANITTSQTLQCVTELLNQLQNITAVTFPLYGNTILDFDSFFHGPI